MDVIENRDLYSHLYDKIISECSNLLGCRYDQVLNITHYMSPIYNSDDFYRHKFNGKDQKTSALGQRKFIFRHKVLDLKIVYYQHYFHNAGICAYFVKKSDWMKAYRALVKINRENRPKVYLNDDIKEKIDEFIDSCRRFRTGKFGIKINRGLLLSGKPGNGKTYVGRVIFDRIGTVYTMYTENSLIKGVANDHDLGDCLIDDISSKMLAREDSVASTVLSKLDNGIGSLANIRIFTTNESIESIDHAFLRPGRIDTVIAIESPNEKTRTEIFSNWNSNIVFDIEKIVDATAGSTYAELNMYKIYMVDSYMKNGCIDTEEIINRSKKALNIEQNKQMGFR
jgi:hypothetical protein